MYDYVLFIGGKDIVDCFTHYIFCANQVTSTINTQQSANNNNSVEINLNSYILNITYRRDKLPNKLEIISNEMSPSPDLISSCFFINCKFVF